MDESSPIRADLLEILRCPVCHAKVRLEALELICDGCARRYQIDDGIPVMLAEDSD